MAGEIRGTYDLSCTWDRQDVEVNRAEVHVLHILPRVVGERKTIRREACESLWTYGIECF
jgi:hypothetical protein